MDNFAGAHDQIHAWNESDFVGNDAFAFENDQFFSDIETPDQPIGLQELEYLDLDSGNNISAPSAFFPEGEGLNEEQNATMPVWSDLGSSYAVDSVSARDVSENHLLQQHAGEYQEYGGHFFDEIGNNDRTDHAGNGEMLSSRYGDSTALQLGTLSSHDPLDGMDDFRALLEAAEKDEMRRRPPATKETKVDPPKTRGRPRVKKPKATLPPSKPKKQPKVKLPRQREIPKIKIVPHIPQEPTPSFAEGVMGMVPKYRAKNRLRSIIKRKPGTQDTDLMSSNVEILGGRVDKQTLSWLRENFEEQPGQIMRREFLYERYLEFCQQTGREAMNAACVGKVVRTVFQGLSTRRLGRRGGSKYHYVNLQVVESSAFAPMPQSVGSAHKTGRKTKKIKAAQSWNDSIKLSDDASDEFAPIANVVTARVWTKNQKKLEAVELDFVTSGLSDAERSRRNILQLATNCLVETAGTVDDLYVIPDDLRNEERWKLIIPLEALASDQITLSDLTNFLRTLRLHIGMLGGMIGRMHFHCVPEIITNFWQHREPSLQVLKYSDDSKFRQILQFAPIQCFIKRIFCQFFEKLFAFFMPTKYGNIPEHLRCVFRDSTAKFDKWMVMATDGLPITIREILISTVIGFSRTVESMLDVNTNLELLSSLDKNKSSRPVVATIVNSILTNGCLTSRTINQADRTSIKEFLLKFQELTEGRNMGDQWDAWMSDYLQKRLSAIRFPGESHTVRVRIQASFKSDTRCYSSQIRSNMKKFWMELEGSIRFPGFTTGAAGSLGGLIRFLRDSVSFAIDYEKAHIWGKSMIGLYAEVAAPIIPILLQTPVKSCDHTLDHYIQCGIPISLVNSRSRDFFASIPELSGLIAKVDPQAKSPNKRPKKPKLSPPLDCASNSDRVEKTVKDVNPPLAAPDSPEIRPLAPRQTRFQPPLIVKIRQRMARHTVAPRIKFK